MEDQKKGILLESGTNEIEIMEFTIDGNLYGINNQFFGRLVTRIFS